MAAGYTELESAIDILVRTFSNYARENSCEMNRTEFQQCVVQELPHILTNTQHDEAVNQLFHFLGNDPKISFHSYWKFIGKIAKKLKQRMALQYQE